MNSAFHYADLLAILDELGFDCTAVRDGFRVCEHKPSDTMIVLADYPADQGVREQVLVGVGLQLEKRGILARGDFDRQVTLRTGAVEGNGTARPRKNRSRVPGGPG